MPTENRSSNTEMAAQLNPCPYCGQQDAFVEQLDSDASVVICQGRIDERSACLARGPVGVQQHECEDQPGHDQAVKEWNKRAAVAHHPDPIAWMVGTAFWWTKEEAERDSTATGLPIVPVGPLSGGVEAEQLREVIKHSDAQIMRQSMRISNQRAQLAEAQALLRTQDELLSQAYQRDIGTLLKREIREISAALSASAEPSVPATPYPNRLCHIDYTTHPYLCGCLKGDEEAQRRYDEQFAKPGAGPSSPLPPVDGDLLPPIGSKVLIHLARENEWVEHTVVGYYAWENLRSDPSVHRVCVRVRDADGYLNARGLGDIRPVALERQP
ncbi:Lar family restriction alleviation protein [Pseudomonas fulva]